MPSSSWIIRWIEFQFFPESDELVGFLVHGSCFVCVCGVCMHVCVWLRLCMCGCICCVVCACMCVCVTSILYVWLHVLCVCVYAPPPPANTKCYWFNISGAGHKFVRSYSAPRLSSVTKGAMASPGLQSDIAEGGEIMWRAENFPLVLCMRTWLADRARWLTNKTFNWVDGWVAFMRTYFSET